MSKLIGVIKPSSQINVSITGGARGQQGKSAYIIWLEQGNDGTEQDFLASLKGDKGDKGEKGDMPIAVGDTPPTDTIFWYDTSE